MGNPLLSLLASTDYPALQRLAEQFEMILDDRNECSTRYGCRAPITTSVIMKMNGLTRLPNWLNGLVMPAGGRVMQEQLPRDAR